MTAQPAAAPERQAFWGKCVACGHCWTVCFLPLELEKAARLMLAAACPQGCEDKVLVARQKDGVLLEESS